MSERGAPEKHAHGAKLTHPYFSSPSRCCCRLQNFVLVVPPHFRERQRYYRRDIRPYDSTISSSYARIKAEESSCKSSSNTVVWLSVACGTLGFGLLGTLVYVALDKGWISLGYRQESGGGDGKEGLLG